MTETSDHRSTILASIRRSLGTAQAPGEIAAEYASIQRTYRRYGEMDHNELLDFFEDRLREYDAGVYRAVPDAIASMISEILTKRGKHGLAIPVGIPTSWLPQGFVFDEIVDEDAYRLDRSEGVMTGCTVAIAETGSIILQNAAGQGARIASLVPDYHLCVVLGGQIVSQVPEAFDRLASSSSLPTTFISGPSATADIEMTRIKGVHGPRFLDVLIVTELGV
jgi:L-lactate dehydrogenase complex protein LldG